MRCPKGEGGIGPVNETHAEAGKLFAGSYVLFSGLIFLVVISLIFTPVLHRILHKLHFEKTIVENLMF